MIDPIPSRFHRAAATYDANATVQAQVADRLVAQVPEGVSACRILDLGCGTGVVTAAAQRRWPQAAITAVDCAPAMLVATQRRAPAACVILGDATQMEFEPEFDLILSGMMAQWLPEPAAALRRWTEWLAPGGHLAVALPIAGSFHEWRTLCQSQGLRDRLWPLPRVAPFADMETEQKTLTVVYDSAQDFLGTLKRIGASTPHPDHTPLKVAQMRRVLKSASQPFPVTYRILYVSAFKR